MDGRSGSKTVVAFLPGSLGGYLQTLETNIIVELKYVRKLVFKHQISFDMLGDIQATIDNGHCMLSDPKRLTFLYVKDNVHPTIYFLVIKTNRNCDELWLVTFYRIRRKQFAKHLDLTKLIRIHLEQDFMG